MYEKWLILMPLYQNVYVRFFLSLLTQYRFYCIIKATKVRIFGTHQVLASTRVLKVKYQVLVEY